MNEIIHGYVLSVILTKFRINANIQLWQSFSILNFEIGIVSDFLQYINPWVTPLGCPVGDFLFAWIEIDCHLGTIDHPTTLHTQ